MNYKKFSNGELLESYQTMLDYSGKADGDIMKEIEFRGGLEQVQINMEKDNIFPNEIKRIKKMVCELYQTDPNPETIKQSITSDIFSPEDLSKIIDSAISNFQHHLKDNSINARTIYGSILGTAISSIINSALWCYSMIASGHMYYILTGGMLVISYIIIRLLTRQSINNTIVFLASFASTFIAFILGIYFYKLIAD